MKQGKKSRNSTQVACSAETLREARNRLGLNQVEMAALLETPLRTYQDWESGRRRFPGVVAVAIRLLQERDRWVMNGIVETLHAKLDQTPGFLPRR